MKICLVILFLFLYKGDYNVVKGGKMSEQGTIPSEVGKLRNLKFVVFCKFFHEDFCF